MTRLESCPTIGGRFAGLPEPGRPEGGRNTDRASPTGLVDVAGEVIPAGRPIGFVALVRAAIDARMATAAMAAKEVLADSQNVASCNLLDFIEATGRDCSLSTTSVNRRGPPWMPRRSRVSMA